MLSNFELKFDFLERLENKYEKMATKSKTMTNISFLQKKVAKIQKEESSSCQYSYLY